MAHVAQPSELAKKKKPKKIMGTDSVVDTTDLLSQLLVVSGAMSTTKTVEMMHFGRKMCDLVGARGYRAMCATNRRCCELLRTFSRSKMKCWRGRCEGCLRIHFQMVPACGYCMLCGVKRGVLVKLSDVDGSLRRNLWIAKVLTKERGSADLVVKNFVVVHRLDWWPELQAALVEGSK
jgi:hypothetical protein